LLERSQGCGEESTPAFFHAQSFLAHPMAPSAILKCDRCSARAGLAALAVLLAAAHTGADESNAVCRVLPSAIQPARRTDPNSELAHRQLIDKAKQGRIDLYFIGDSITRRWGASDPQYGDLLASWQKNFHGWNAANFGWGADTIQNILWRLQNGELDGVHPKVIVILAGTNNIGAEARGKKATEVAAGIQALISVCHDKAPGAVIILTAIFPRNDNMAVLPTIKQANERIAALADGKKVRYLNVNHKLADGDGKLYDGMMADKLHPTVKGYQAWADGLRPILVELLGPPAKTDDAPPPTGDPSAR
jgi:lysophospholipase L1-like esterase